MEKLAIGILLLLVIAMGVMIAKPFMDMISMFGFEQALVIIFLGGH